MVRYVCFPLVKLPILAYISEVYCMLSGLAFHIICFGIMDRNLDTCFFFC